MHTSDIYGYTFDVQTQRFRTVAKAALESPFVDLGVKYLGKEIVVSAIPYLHAVPTDDPEAIFYSMAKSLEIGLNDLEMVEVNKVPARKDLGLSVKAIESSRTVKISLRCA